LTRHLWACSARLIDGPMSLALLATWGAAVSRRGPV
jgi:hypothetical protein